MSPEEITYYRERAAIERQLAETAENQRAGEIHAELASLYESLIALEHDHAPNLRLVEPLRAATA